MRRLGLLALLVAIAGPAWCASLPNPAFACNSGAVDDTTCDSRNVASLTITKPTQVVTGDLMVALCFNADGATDLSISGWTEFNSEVTQAGTRASVFYKLVADAEGNSTLTITGGGTAAASGCIVSSYMGIAQSSSLDTSGNTSGNGTTITLPSLTTAADKALVWYGCQALAATATATPPASYTEEMDASGGSHAWIVKASAGSTGTQTVTLSASDNYICYHAAFKYNTAGTRIYLPSSGAPAVSPTFDAAWEDNDQADRIAAVFTRGSTAMADHTSNEETADTTAKDHLNRQYSIQIGAQTISGVVQCNVRTIESNAAANAVAGLKLWLADSSGASTSEVLLDSTNAGNSTDEYAAGATCSSGCAARNFPAKARTHTLTSQTASDQDYLVIEFGSYYNNTSSTARTDTFRFGDTAATPLDRDDAETADNHPWCDFLSGLTAYTPPPGSCAQSIALLGVGCR